MILYLLFVCLCITVHCEELWRLAEIPDDYITAFHADPHHVTDPGPCSVVSDPAGGDNQVLKVIYHKGSWSTHGPTTGFLQFFAKPTSQHTTLTLSYDVYFDPNFDFVKGGTLPGLWGGLTNCSGGRHSENCFSTRFMWRRNGDGEIYAYITPREKQVPGFCDDKICNSVYGYSLGRGTWRFQRGQWQNIAQYIQLNTPGKSDGSIKVWFNHQLVYELNDVNIRQRDDVMIDGIFFSTFFGGGDSSWAPSRDVSTCFKNFVLSSDELWRLADVPDDYITAFHADPHHVTDPGHSSVVPDPAGGDNNVLKVIYHEGSWSTHGPTTGFLQVFAKPTSQHTTLTLSYDVYFDPNFDFAKGGKLPGLWGGWRKCSGGRHTDECFSTRFMWRRNGDGEVYAYIAPRDKQVPGFCDDKHCNSVYGYSLGRGTWRFQRGQWQNIAQYVKLNTVGKSDGIIKVWFNQQLVYELNDVNIRQKDNVKIDGIFFSTFFGGGDSSWAPSRDVFTCFKNFVLSTNPTHPLIIG